MRSTYSSALRDLLEDVVQTSTPPTTNAPRPAHPRHLWRSVAITTAVAAAVIAPTTLILTNSTTPDRRLGDAASHTDTPTITPTSTSSIPPAPLVYLGLVTWTRPQATSNPTSTIYITENWDPLRNRPGTCGIALAKPTATVSADSTVTITVRGYGYRSTPEDFCSDVWFAPGPVAVPLPAETDVRAVTDPASHTTTPLTIASHPDQLHVIHVTPAP